MLLLVRAGQDYPNRKDPPTLVLPLWDCCFELDSELGYGREQVQET